MNRRRSNWREIIIRTFRCQCNDSVTKRAVVPVELLPANIFVAPESAIGIVHGGTSEDKIAVALHLFKAQFGNSFSSPQPCRFVSTLAFICLLTVILLPIGFASGPKSSRHHSAPSLSRRPTANKSSSAMQASFTPSPKDGGTARRLTSGPGYSSFPHFSPDGKQLAFTSQYDGNTEVYVMPATAANPKRLTTTATLGRDDISDRMGPNNIVMGWENTKPLVVFRSRRTSFNSFIGDLETVGLECRLARARYRCRAAASSPSRRTIRRWPTTASFASSAPGNIIAAAWPTTSGFTISRPKQTENLTNDPGAGYLPDVGPGQSHLFPLRSRRSDEPLFDRPRQQGDEAAHHLQGFRHQVPDDRQRTQSSSKRPATSGATTSAADNPRRSRSRSRKISPPAAPPFSTPRSISNPSTSRRTASAPSWLRAAIFFPCR